MERDENPRVFQKRGKPSLAEYLQMGEEEKNNSVQQSLFRLQNRIFEIVYLMEAELKRVRQSSHDDDPSNNMRG